MSDFLKNIKISVKIEFFKRTESCEFALDNYDDVTEMLEAVANWIRGLLAY